MYQHTYAYNGTGKAQAKDTANNMQNSMPAPPACWHVIRQANSGATMNSNCALGEQATQQASPERQARGGVAFVLCLRPHPEIRHCQP